MHFGVPVVAHGCTFNRYSTEDKARYFETAEELSNELYNLDPDAAERLGADMIEIAQRKYTGSNRKGLFSASRSCVT